MQRLQGFANRVSTSGLLVLIIAFFLLSPLASGQLNQGSIAGNVVDPTGAMVAGAKLTAKGQSTGASIKRYRAAPVPIAFRTSTSEATTHGQRRWI